MGKLRSLVLTAGAILALVGTGEFESVPEVCRSAIREVETVEPDAVEQHEYARRHAIYQSLYPALRPFFSATAVGL